MSHRSCVKQLLVSTEGEGEEEKKRMLLLLLPLPLHATPLGEYQPHGRG